MNRYKNPTQVNNPEAVKRINEAMKDMQDSVIQPDKADELLSAEFDAGRIDKETYKKYYRRILRALKKQKELNQ